MTACRKTVRLKDRLSNQIYRILRGEINRLEQSEALHGFVRRTTPQLRREYLSTARKLLKRERIYLRLRNDLEIRAKDSARHIYKNWLRRDQLSLPYLRSMADLEAQDVIEKIKEAAIRLDHRRQGIIKEWVTNIDGRERPAHHHANGQQVPLDKEFEVDGELLMHPGDWRRGASPANIINCRCCVKYMAPDRKGQLREILPP